MTKTYEEIERLVAAELDLIRDAARREELRRYLVEPRLVMLGWDYGDPDELPCWLIGRRSDGRYDLVYCDDGFGPSFPWGCVFPDEASMGMDAQWSVGLENAAIKAGLLDAPPGYQEPGSREGA